MDRSYTAIADASGTATASVSDSPPPGRCWVIAQFTIETNVFRAGCSATIKRNGRFVSSSSLGSADTAYGPPPVVMNPGMAITCAWVGLTQGDQAILTIWYAEQENQAQPDPNIVV